MKGGRRQEDEGDEGVGEDEGEAGHRVQAAEGKEQAFAVTLNEAKDLSSSKIQNIWEESMSVANCYFACAASVANFLAFREHSINILDR